MNTWEHKGKQPPRVKQDMDAWRAGMGSMKTYIRYHKDIAERTLHNTARKYDLDILKTRLKGDGWMDGMHVLHAVVETPSGELVKLKWRDSHGNGSWFKQHGSGGSSRMYEEDLK